MSDTPDPATHISSGELREQAQFARQGNYAGVSGDLDAAANYIDALVLANDRLRAERALLVRVENRSREMLKAVGDNALRSGILFAWRALNVAIAALDAHREAHRE